MMSTSSDENTIELAKILRDYVSENYLEIARDILSAKPHYIYNISCNLPNLAISSLGLKAPRGARSIKTSLCKANEALVKELHSNGCSYQSIANRIGCSTTTVGNYLKFKCQDIESAYRFSFSKTKSSDLHLIMEAYFEYVTQFPSMCMMQIASKIYQQHDYGYVTLTGMRVKYKMNTLVSKIHRELRELKSASRLEK